MDLLKKSKKCRINESRVIRIKISWVFLVGTISPQREHGHTESLISQEIQSDFSQREQWVWK